MVPVQFCEYWDHLNREGGNWAKGGAMELDVRFRQPSLAFAAGSYETEYHGATPARVCLQDIFFGRRKIRISHTQEGTHGKRCRR